ncbi:MAG TPA: SBBP repeat-containing protein [Terriglobales bacterium]|jgi:hypothetical protein|nr:SBBP repeat-containing protein [Terriglobales bacterium]
MRFEANQGQARQGVEFAAASGNYAVALKHGGMTVRLSHADGRGFGEVKIELVGSTPHAVIPEDKLEGYSNYLFGPDPAKWITNVPQYGKVRYPEIYPGIDVVYYGKQDRLEHDFVVRAGASPSQIEMALSGVQSAKVNEAGDLVMRLSNGEIRLQKPYAYQWIAKRKTQVAAEYALNNGHVGFLLARYDHSQPLVIDPVLVYSTFLGATFPPEGAIQSATAIATDGSGNLYITGPCSAANFPVTQGVLGETQQAAFVAKLNSAGTSLTYATYLGGVDPKALAVDQAGNVFVAGGSAAGLPIPTGSTPFQSTARSRDVAIVKLNNTATAALYATYLGGTGDDTFAGLAIDPDGNAYIAGTTTSNDFPTQSPLQASLGSGQNAFITKINPAGSDLVFSTYLGQATTAGANGIAIDSARNIYAVGEATPGFPTTVGSIQPASPDACADCQEPFFAKLNPAGGAILYATYLASTNDTASTFFSSMALDGAGDAFLLGAVFTNGFPEVRSIQSCSDSDPSRHVRMLLAEINASGTLAFSTCLGGFAFGSAITLDASHNVYITGGSDGSLPLVNPIDADAPGLGPLANRLFVSKINPDTGSLLFSSFLADASTAINAIAVDSTGSIYLGGASQIHADILAAPANNLFPIFNALQPDFNLPDACPSADPRFSQGCFYSDAILMKISPAAGAAAAVAPSQLRFVTPQSVNVASTSQDVTVSNLGTSPLTVSGATVTGDFSIQNGCGTVSPAGASCTIHVTFSPTVLGTRTGLLTISDSSAGSPRTVELSGTAGNGSGMLSPSSLTFPTQPVGTASSTQSAILKNTGDIALSIGHIATTGSFSETNNCATSILPGAQCEIDVAFAPSSQGSDNGTLQVTDNAVNSPQTITLSGVGGPNLGLAVASGDSNTATVAAGATAAFKLAVGGTGTAGTVTLTCTGAPTAATCSVPASVAVTASTASQFDVSVTTTARTTSALARNRQWFSESLLWSFGIFGWVSVLGMRRRKAYKDLPLLLTVVVLMGALSSCGGGRKQPPPPFGTPAGTYTLTVSAQSGTVTQSTALTMVVQ